MRINRELPLEILAVYNLRRSRANGMAVTATAADLLSSGDSPKSKHFPEAMPDLFHLDWHLVTGNESNSELFKNREYFTCCYVICLFCNMLLTLIH